MQNIVQDSPSSDQTQPPRRPVGRWRSLIANGARILISLGLLAFILSRVGLAQLATTAAQADWRLGALAIGLGLAGVILRAFRWLILLRAVGARVSFGRAVYLYFIGAFFNSFLPTGLGGDVIRVLEIGPGATSQQAAGTAVVDRLTGFLMLFLMTLVALPLAAAQLPGYILGPITALALAVVAASALLFEGRLLRRGLAWLGRLFAPAGRQPPGWQRLYQTFISWLEQTYQVITACGWQAVVGASLVSLIFNLSQILAIVLLGRALGLNVPAWAYFIFIPVVSTILLVPFTISGLGARELLIQNLFALAPMRLLPEQALALSLAIYSLDLTGGLVGGVIYLLAGLSGLRRR